MTLIVTVNGPETIWLLADRRLSRAGRPPQDDARKLMLLETTDGVAILGYAGLGATALGTEPADWMSAVLRGRSLPLDQSLRVLAEAMKQRLPNHMKRMPVSGGPAHQVFAPAFIGTEARLYSIDLVFSPDRRQCFFRHTHHVIDRPVLSRPRPPRLAITGSGALHLEKDQRWMRVLLRLVRASDRLKLTPHAVADHLARLNSDVHLADPLVGPRCIVAWRNRREGVHRGGGGHLCYTGTTRDDSSPALPSIAKGTDMAAFLGVVAPHTMKVLQAMMAGQAAPEIDKDALNAELALLPENPDENLR
jgi:hypothetical protein